MKESSRKGASWHRPRLVTGLGLLMLLLNLGQAGTASMAVAAESGLPAASRIENMPVFAQWYNLSCEYSATRAAVARWGGRLDDNDFIEGIAYNDNPHLGFRGNINGGWGGTNNYGIYAEPIARFLGTKGYNTKLLWNGVQSIKEEVALGRPVVIWIAGSMGWGEPYEASLNGQNFMLMAYEHAMTLYGYDENGVYVADPGFGSLDYYSWEAFTRSWGYLGNMALSVWPSSQGSTPGERPGVAPEFYRYWLRNHGLELMGQPLAHAFVQDGKTIQYFERARLEYDNSLPGTQPIGRGLLGREITANRQNEAEFKPLSEQEINLLTPPERAWLFGETGQVIAAEFAGFWQTRGGLAAFGYPISRAFYEGGLKVQYFERVRLESHLDGPDYSMKVRLGLLGSLLLPNRPN